MSIPTGDVQDAYLPTSFCDRLTAASRNVILLACPMHEQEPWAGMPVLGWVAVRASDTDRMAVGMVSSVQVSWPLKFQSFSPWPVWRSHPGSCGEGSSD